ncbi:sensor histidine kinase [Tellurirhabdus bombi]|uniref:sensor histidine kinase n=1 Tax=Tellurirhabdus bombi TaxID=2907205 RepID=UPI001F3AAC0D|nr:HAMP domain-containing sensor histidine kinase [Tellurirhabdus bombi]
MQWKDFHQQFHEFAVNSKKEPDLTSYVSLIRQYMGARLCCVIRQYNATLADLLYVSPTITIPGLFPFKIACAAPQNIALEALPRALQLYFQDTQRIYCFPLRHASMSGYILLAWDQSCPLSDEDINEALFFLQDKILLQMVSLQVADLKRQIASRFPAASEGLSELNNLSALYRINQQLLDEHNTLERKNEELAEVNREIESLISVIAHDLKSPLATINAIFQHLNTIPELSEEQRENIDYGMKTVRRGVDLINSIVFYNSLVYAEQPLQITEIELDDLIEALAAGYEVQARQKSIGLHLSMPSQPIVIHSDFELVVRILDNLISNALKFTPMGRNVYISVYQQADRCYIAIRDEGPGIQPNERAQLFKRFQRLSARPTNSESSSGLGLSIVKALADKLGATIDFTEAETGGSIFRLGLAMDEGRKSIPTEAATREQK